jgi:hypothetical protein
MKFGPNPEQPSFSQLLATLVAQFQKTGIVRGAPDGISISDHW